MLNENEKWIIRQLRQRWMVLKEITHYLETSVNLTWRWIDKMTGRLLNRQECCEFLSGFARMDC